METEPLLVSESTDVMTFHYQEINIDSCIEITNKLTLTLVQKCLLSLTLGFYWDNDAINIRLKRLEVKRYESLFCSAEKPELLTD